MMYPSERIEAQIEQYTNFFNSSWQLLVESLIEVASDPDNQKLQARIRSLTTLLQVTVATMDYLQKQRQKATYSQPVIHQELYGLYASQ